MNQMFIGDDLVQSVTGLQVQTVHIPRGPDPDSPHPDDETWYHVAALGPGIPACGIVFAQFHFKEDARECLGDVARNLFSGTGVFDPSRVIDKIKAYTSTYET